MTMFGLKEAEVAELVRAVAGEDGISLEREAVEDRFARAAWSGIAEPGDRVAGAVIDALSAAGALKALIEQRPLTGGAVDELAQGVARWHPRINSGAALMALRQAARFGARLRVPDDADWPVPFGDLGLHAPIALWTRGREDAIGAFERSIALVGARAATGYGEHVTMEASAGLVDRGYAIVSGAAYGIDGMAHRAALASKGTTIAFLAGGVDRFYPSGHDALLTRIVEHGLVVSELPCGQPPTRWRFLQRNRLIAASTLATVVIEAGWRSGSLNTANHARDLGRPIGAVPGPVTSAASAGCHRLIREGHAELVTNADEMAQLAPLVHLNPLFSIDTDRGKVPSAAQQRPEVTRVLDALSTRSARGVADVAARSGLAVSEAAAVLAVLELDGVAEERELGWRKVTRDR